MKLNELYDTVTANIIRQLEEGTPTWVRPWKYGKSVGALPTNIATKRSYSGINVPILWCQKETMFYPTHHWLTFKQALDLGGCVRKHERSTTVVFTKPLLYHEGEETRKVSMLRTYNVFNVAQCDGLDPFEEPPLMTDHARHEGADTFIKSTGADIRYGGDRACYVPLLDFVSIPHKPLFLTTESFYAVSLHELVHWSGAKKRLDRDMQGRFGTKAYAAEELVAELGAAFSCAHLRITGELRHASYIATWIELLKEDNRAIFVAAAKAAVAANYLRSFSEPPEEDE
jgi:antirestriction protein ArdC